MFHLGRTVLAGVATIPPTSAATYNLVKHRSGKCVSVAGGGGTANGAKLVQWTATGNSEQLWRWDARVIDA